MNNPGIPLGEAAICVDCAVLFSVRDRQCPRCGSEDGWYLLEKKKAENATAAADPAAAAKEDQCSEKRS